MGKDTTVQEKTEGKSLDFYLLKTRRIVLSGEIEKELTASIIKQLFILESQDSKSLIELFIDSPGGDADAGLAVYDCINYLKAPVYTVGMGLVASAAALIFLAPPKERRLSFFNARYLIHQPSSSMRGVASEIEIFARELEFLKNKLNQIVAQKTGQALKSVAEHSSRDHWMGAQEALDYGLVGKIL